MQPWDRAGRKEGMAAFVSWCLRNPGPIQYRHGASDTHVLVLFGIADGNPTFFDCAFHMVVSPVIRTTPVVMRAVQFPRRTVL